MIRSRYSSDTGETIPILNDTRYRYYLSFQIHEPVVFITILEHSVFLHQDLCMIREQIWNNDGTVLEKYAFMGDLKQNKPLFVHD